MRVLIDECVPKKFKFSLIAFEHECLTAPEAGLAGKQNGELLALAETRFDVFLTLDKGFEYQQTLAARKISIVIIRAKSNPVRSPERMTFRLSPAFFTNPRHG